MAQHQNNIVLTGMPAVGKSTLGVVLAKHIGFAFTDTDLLIQTGEGVGLQHIIKKVGIEKFCDLEAKYVQKMNAKNTVIATGGSVIYRQLAMKHLQKMGCIVFLDIQLPCLVKRLKEMEIRGVVHNPGQTIKDIYAERRPLYKKYAQITIDCTDFALEATVQKVMSKLKKNYIILPLQ